MAILGEEIHGVVALGDLQVTTQDLVEMASAEAEAATATGTQHLIHVTQATMLILEET